MPKEREAYSRLATQGSQRAAVGEGDPGSHGWPALAIPHKLGAAACSTRQRAWEESSLIILGPMPLCYQPCLSPRLIVPHGVGSRKSMLESNAGVRGKGCEKLSWLEVGPEVLPPSLRRSSDAGCNVFLLVQVGTASSHGPVLAQLALQKVF